MGEPTEKLVQVGSDYNEFPISCESHLWHMMLFWLFKSSWLDTMAGFQQTLHIALAGVGCRAAFINKLTLKHSPG